MKQLLLPDGPVGVFILSCAINVAMVHRVVTNFSVMNLLVAVNFSFIAQSLEVAVARFVRIFYFFLLN